MLSRSFLACILLSLFTSAANSRTKPSPAADPDYVVALSAANQFLHAWQAHDEEAGILLLTDRLREHTREEYLAALLVASPTPQAYEIFRGRKLAAGRYQFPIALWQSSAPNPPSTAHHSPHPRVTTLIVTRTPKDDWLIDKLP